MDVHCRHEGSGIGRGGDTEDSPGDINGQRHHGQRPHNRQLAAIVPNRTAKYTRVDGQLRNAPAIDMSNRLPAGGYLTTASDLGRFIEAVLNDKLVKHATLATMTTPAKLQNGQTVEYGLGWGVETDEWQQGPVDVSRRIEPRRERFHRSQWLDFSAG
jgi:CubicO group peptidase (beta-lactamase class C family)